MSFRVAVDRDLCIGTGNCIRLARGAFALDSSDVAVVVDPDAASEEDLLAAERSCPMGAISVREQGIERARPEE
jgi:ferredoxin